MKQIYWNNKDVSVGAARFPDRRKPSIIIRKGAIWNEYGFFKNEVVADLFVEELGKLIWAKTVEEKGGEEWNTINILWVTTFYPN